MSTKTDTCALRKNEFGNLKTGMRIRPVRNDIFTYQFKQTSVPSEIIVREIYERFILCQIKFENHIDYMECIFIDDYRNGCTSADEKEFPVVNVPNPSFHQSQISTYMQ